eukprot:6283885-Amphidinium_carterae.1
MRKAVQDATSSPLEALRLSLVYNTARAKFGREFVDVGSAVSPVVPPQPVAPVGQVNSMAGLAK